MRVSRVFSEVFTSRYLVFTRQYLVFRREYVFYRKYTYLLHKILGIHVQYYIVCGIEYRVVTRFRFVSCVGVSGVATWKTWTWSQSCARSRPSRNSHWSMGGRQIIQHIRNAYPGFRKLRFRLPLGVRRHSLLIKLPPKVGR